MPYKLMNKDGKVCVVKKEDGSVVKCHDDREKAAAHLRALYVNQADASIEEFDNTWTDDTIIEPNDSNNPDAPEPIIAHAEPAAPPADFFSEPPEDVQRRYVTVTEEGRVMGLLATFDECHVGYGDMCVTAPRESDYSHFNVGTVLASDGSSIPTGVLALNGGHADISLDASSARSHYDNPDTGIADIVVGSSDQGIWFSGALRPGVSEDKTRALRASGVSGDWRLIDGQLRLIGICCVNVPGFPKLSVAASADGLTALVAAGSPPLAHPSLCDCDSRMDDIVEELDSMHRLIADAMLEDTVIEKLSNRIVNDIELDDLFARVE